MRINIILIAICISFSVKAQNSANRNPSVINPVKTSPVIVQTQQGKVEGYTENGVAVFKGIPFAAPPVGKLRWKAPQAPAPWDGVRACKTFSASPVQPTPVPFLCWSVEFIAPPEPLSEDCLYLNVWTAADPQKEKRPVFVWIYGGGFSSGSAACAIYDGQEMANRGIVFVSINYRVGAFGFMAHPDLTKEQGVASGNYGLMDQIAALEWVKKNIAAFGGDPSQITIGGQSAGSFAVNALVASPLAKDLFRGAIAESGGMLGDHLPGTLADAEKVGLAIQKMSAAKTIDEMRLLPADSILNMSQHLEGKRMGLNLDGYVLPKDPWDYFKKDNQNDVFLLTGWVTGDGALFGPINATPASAQKDARQKYGEQADFYLSAFPAANDEQAKASQQLGIIVAFAAFPSQQWALFNKHPAYLYEISNVPTDLPGFPNYGAFHTSEVPYALHTLHLWKRPWTEHDYMVEELLSSYWLNFIKTGNPNGSNLPVWKKYDDKDGFILEVSNSSVARLPSMKKQFETFKQVNRL
ncbi:MAG TPA: carboxylesterase family protein [Puia sp.]